jgi:hypothetical protein
VFKRLMCTNAREQRPALAQGYGNDGQFDQINQVGLQEAPGRHAAPE